MKLPLTRHEAAPVAVKGLLTLGLHLLTLGAAQTLTPAQVTSLPLLFRYQAEPARQNFSAAEKYANQTLIRRLASRPELKKYVAQQVMYFDGLNERDVVFTLKAPFRNQEPETLTVVNLYEAEPPIQLLHLSGNRSAREAAWVTEPQFNSPKPLGMSHAL